MGGLPSWRSSGEPSFIHNFAFPCRCCCCWQTIKSDFITLLQAGEHLSSSGCAYLYERTVKRTIKGEKRVELEFCLCHTQRLLCFWFASTYHPPLQVSLVTHSLTHWLRVYNKRERKIQTNGDEESKKKKVLYDHWSSSSSSGMSLAMECLSLGPYLCPSVPLVHPLSLSIILSCTID